MAVEVTDVESWRVHFVITCGMANRKNYRKDGIVVVHTTFYLVCYAYSNVLLVEHLASMKFLVMIESKL